MHKEKYTKDFGWAVLVIVLSFLFACSFATSSRHITGDKPQTESVLYSQLQHQALVTTNSKSDNEAIFTIALKKYPDHILHVIKMLINNRLINHMMAVMRKNELLHSPSPLVCCYFHYQYHSQKTDNYPALG